jgi:hypothetical protein
MTEGQLSDRPLSLVVESDLLVAFGDGIEADSIALTWGLPVRGGLSFSPTKRSHSV